MSGASLALRALWSRRLAAGGVGHSVPEEVAVPRKVRDMIKLVETDGWYLVAQRGSHRQYKHPVKRGRVTIPGKPSRDLYPDLERSILKQAGLIGGEK